MNQNAKSPQPSNASCASPITPEESIKDWVTIEQFCSLFPNISEPTVRWQLTSRNRNGLAPHVKVIGKQRYISVTGYANWLQE
jgi:hypothetical protein